MKKIINSEGFSLVDFFFFNKMITPVIITILYWVTLVLIVLSGLGVIIASFHSFQYSFLGGLIAFFTGVIGLIVGVISARIGFELVCVLFNINRNIEKLAVSQNSSNEDQNSDDKQ